MPVLEGNLFNLLTMESGTFHFLNDIWNLGGVLQTDRLGVLLAAE